MNIQLENKNALVCGSTGGIGKATAIALAAAGANVTLVARNADKLAEVMALLDTGKGQKHDFLAVDFSDHNAVKTAVNQWMADGRNYQVLLNNTGGPPAGKITDASTEEFLQAFNNHLLCNHVLTQAVIPGMKKTGYGRIVNVISTSVKIPLKGLGVSNTIRGAVGNWSKTLATELAPDGITVNNILPGATGTERLSSIIHNKSAKTGLDTDAVTKEMLEEIPMGRFAQPEEIAYAAVFLSSPQAAYITGTNIVVDGGRTGSL